jgi:hypothetical protein
MGESGVGKTTLINKFCQRIGDNLPTIGVDFQIKYMTKIFPKAKNSCRVRRLIVYILDYQTSDLGYRWKRKFSPNHSLVIHTVYSLYNIGIRYYIKKHI